MKKVFVQFAILLGVAITSLNVNAQVSCPGANGPTKIIFGTNKAGVGSKITTNTTWFRDTIYILKNYVRVAAGATLTIQAGTIIMGSPAPIDTSCLIIERDADIIANGTAALPIVFTSCKLIGTKNRGDWGGLVILGKATNNLGTNIQLEGNYGAFHGGTDDTDNSGSLQFVRIEFAGQAFEPNRELNGLTLGSVGRGTILRNIQVSFGNDDAFEWFGGTVCSQRLLAWNTLDDDFDADNGYRGFNQFGIAYRNPEIADVSGSEAFEIDNDATSSNNTPKTAPIFCNYEAWGPITTTSITRINPFYRAAAHIRRNSEPKFYNTLLIAFPSDSTRNQAAGFWIDGATTVQNIVKDSIRLRCNVVASYGTPKRILSNRPFSEWAPFATPEALYNRTADRNSVNANVLLTSKRAPLRYEPDFAVFPGSPMSSGSSFTTPGVLPLLPIAGYPNGFQSVAFRGAMGGTNWALGSTDWVEYRPQLFVYTAGQPTRKSQMDAFLSGDNTMAMNSDAVVCMPSPTVGATTFNFIIDNANVGTVNVYDMVGNNVYSVETNFNTGLNVVDFNAANLAVGNYIVKVAASNGAFSKAGKLQVVR